MADKYYIGYIFEDADFEAAVWCDKHQDCHLVEIEAVDGKRRFQIQEKLAPTLEELLTQAKAERAAAVASITVEVDGMVFDGNEKAQERMSRAVNMADSMDEQTKWVLHDNTVAIVTAAQLRQACRLAGQKQTELWTMPYEA